MKFRLEHIAEIYNALIYICQVEFVSKTSYWFSRFKDKIEPEHNLYQKERGKLENKYGKWKYRMEKNVTKDGASVLEVETLTLKVLDEQQKYWENEKGEKVAQIMNFNPRLSYWEANSDEDGLAFNEALKSLHEMEFGIPLDPIALNRLVRKEGKEEIEVNIPGNIFSSLHGIVEDIADKPKEEAKGPKPVDLNKEA